MNAHEGQRTPPTVVATAGEALWHSARLELGCRPLLCSHRCTDSRWTRLSQSNIAVLDFYFLLLLYFVHNCCILQLSFIFSKLFCAFWFAQLTLSAFSCAPFCMLHATCHMSHADFHHCYEFVAFFLLSNNVNANGQAHGRHSSVATTIICADMWTCACHCICCKWCW